MTDTFYLKDARGRKLRDPEALERLKDSLLIAANASAGEGGSTSGETGPA